jgi:hypothetical protein
MNKFFFKIKKRIKKISLKCVKILFGIPEISIENLN